MNCIYTLIDPRDLRVRYIGKTERGYKRINEHVDEARRGDTYKDRWVRELTSNGLKYLFTIVEVVETREQLDNAEKFWITHFRQIHGRDLTNRTDGGTGGRMSPEIRKAHSERMKGRTPWIAGRKHSEETRRKMSEAAKKRWVRMTDEEKFQHNQEVLRKRWQDPEQRRAASERLKPRAKSMSKLGHAARWRNDS